MAKSKRLSKQQHLHIMSQKISHHKPDLTVWQKPGGKTSGKLCVLIAPLTVNMDPEFLSNASSSNKLSELLLKL